ncbi:DUF6378 domain-containing protein [Salipiger pacificus]|nr:DUF6378 domain-containing protein [Alloyangia pacifica]
MKRATTLLTANALIHGEREETYGHPSVSFQRIADLWSIILETGVSPMQVVLCMDALKTARLIQNPHDLDGWIDKTGYSALGAEIQAIEANPDLEGEEPGGDEAARDRIING